VSPLSTRYSAALILALLSVIPLQSLAASPVGDWGGLLPDPLRIIVHITKPQPGGYQVTVEIPDELDEPLQVKAARLNRGRLSISMPQIRAVYRARWNAEQSAWIGKWTQHGGSEPLVLRAVDEAAIRAMAPKRPQEAAIAAHPLPYEQEEVQFGGGTAGVRLAGTFTRPPGRGPFPTVLLICGAGYQNRDADSYQHKLHLVLADDLTRRGLAVLRYDKRGIGGSTGDFSKATEEELIADAAAAARYLESRSDVDHRRIGIIGHSQGGYIAPRVAVTDPAVAFLVLIAAPAAPAEAFARERQALTDADEDVPPEERALNQDLIAAIATPDPAQSRRLIQHVLDQMLALQMISPARAQILLKQLTSPETRARVATDPCEPLRHLSIPVLALNGSLDHQVPAHANLAALREALRDNPDATVLELPGLNHQMTTARIGSEWEYPIIEESSAPIALQTIGTWVAAHAGL